MPNALLRSIVRQACGSVEGFSVCDAELLTRFLDSRDEAAFELLVRRHESLVWGVCRRLLGDNQDAEDAFQAAFLALARKAGSLRDRASLATWLHQVAHRTALRVRAIARKRLSRERQGLNLEEIAPASSDSDTDWKDLRPVLDQAIAALPDSYQTVVVLCYLEGKTYAAAAAELGCPRGTVSIRLTRARELLRVDLLRRGVSLPGGLIAIGLSAGIAAAAPPPALVLPIVSAAVLTRAGKAATGPVSETVSSLAEGVLNTMFRARLKSSAALLLVFVLAGMLGMATALPKQQHAAPAGTLAAERPIPGKQAALPNGAKLRLGDMERRTVGTRLAFSADGKSIIGVRDARWVTVWDAQTGEVREQRELANRIHGWFEVSPNGRWMVTRDDSPIGKPGAQLHLWNLQTGKRVRGFPMLWANHGGTGAFSHDSKRFAATPKFGPRIHVWSVETGEELLKGAIGGKGFCHQVIFSHDGKQVLLAQSQDKWAICCWDLASKRQLWENDRLYPYHIGVTPGGKVVCPVFPKKPVELDLLTGKETTDLPLPDLIACRQLIFTPDGKRVLEAGRDGIEVWEIQTGKKLRTLPGSLAEMVLAPDGKSVLSTTGRLQHYRLSDGKPYFSEENAGHTDEVRALVFSRDGRRLASGGLDGSVRFWDTETGATVRVWQEFLPSRPYVWLGNSHGGVYALSMSPDARWVAAVGGEEQQLRVWDSSTGKEKLSMPPMTAAAQKRQPSVFQLHVDPDGRTAAGLALFHRAPGANGNFLPVALVRWDLAAGKELAATDLEKASYRHTTFAPTGRWVVSAGQVRDAVTGKVISRLGQNDETEDDVAAFSPDGLLIATCRYPSNNPREFARKRPQEGWPVQVWETLTGKAVAEFSVPQRWVDFVWHPDGRHVAVHTSDAVRLWNLRTGKMGKEWLAPSDLAGDPGARIRSFAFSPNGSRLATGHASGSIHLWDARSQPDKPAPLQPRELDSLWDDLRAGDPKTAWKAAWRLSDFPKETVALLGGRLKSVLPAPAETTRVMIAELDADALPRREEATKRLQALGVRAEPGLRAALKDASAEQKRRINKLLAALPQIPVVTTDEMRELRCAALLGWIDTAEARKVLERLAAGVPVAPLTQQANATLGRKHR